MTEKELRCLVEQAKRESRVYEGLIQLWNERVKLQQQLTRCANGGSGQPRLILSEDFVGGGLTSPHLEHFSSMPEIYEEDQQPFFVSCYGTSAGHYYAKEGTNEKTPWEVILNKSELPKLGLGETFDEFCIEWQDFFANNYGFPSSGQKMFRLLYDDSTHPQSKKSTELATLNDNANLQYAAYWLRLDGGTGEWFKNSGESHPLNQWVTWRVWAKLNTPGETNGFIQVYKDGELFISGENLKLREVDDTRGYNMWWIGGNYSNFAGETLPRDGHRYITGIRWWDTLPN